MLWPASTVARSVCAAEGERATAVGDVARTRFADQPRARSPGSPAAGWSGV